MSELKRPIVFVSGCFDIIHGGHIQFLEDAAAYGGSLVVCVPSDRVLQAVKGRVPAMSVRSRMDVVGSLVCVDRVVVGDGNDLPLNFEDVFDVIKPDILISTEDDQYSMLKGVFCEQRGCVYYTIKKTRVEGVLDSTTVIRQKINVPYEVPLRIDFAGGWLDVPKHSCENGYIVNVAIEPKVSLSKWPYKKCSGLGGSAAYALLSGKDHFQTEADMGVGWQDPAIITETGLCVWKSGHKPRLDYKSDPCWLNKKLFLLWTGDSHNTPDLVDKKRDYGLIKQASIMAKRAVLERNLDFLVSAIKLSYLAQRDEGMSKLVGFGEIAKKYCGGGHGGYAVYLFNHVPPNDRFLCVQPYLGQVGEV